MIPNGGGSIILIASMSASVSPIRFVTARFRIVTAISLDHQRPTSKVHLPTPLGVIDDLQIFSYKRPITPRKLVRLYTVISRHCEAHLLQLSNIWPQAWPLSGPRLGFA